MRRRIAALVAVMAVTGLPSCIEDATGPSNAAGVEVLRTIDGDTLSVQTAEGEARVRIIGIDTPEIGYGEPSECFAVEARDMLSALVDGSTVELHADATQGDQDKYGRLLRHVYADGQNVAVALLEAGMADEYTYRDPYEGQTEYRAAEAHAAGAQIGLWGACVSQ